MREDDQQADTAGFELFALPVLAGQLAISPLPGGGGSYRRDLDRVRRWRPALVVSMTTTEEHLSLGVPDLGTDLHSMGRDWRHMPVADYGVPQAAQQPVWDEISAEALSVLLRAGRVLLHCRGGCGRSGMAALRLMIEAGEAPELALDRLRQLRPCAVETDEQLHWALGR